MLIDNISLIIKVGVIIRIIQKIRKAIIYAKSVKEMANKYRKQLKICKKNLDKNKYIIF